MSEAVEEEGGVGVFAEEEATRKRQKKENGVSNLKLKRVFNNVLNYIEKLN